MTASERDDTQDWLLPEGSAPPLLVELEQRIDEALVIAKASERAAVEIGDAALDAAAQARRAAELAERATTVALEAASRPASAADAAPRPAPAGAAGDPVLRSFSERADRVAARLRALERRPRGAHGTSAVAAPRRPGG
jgi:hypothetical protein